MKYIDISFKTPEENIAFDEALLNLSEKENEGPLIRFWSTNQTFVVLGLGNKIKKEVNIANCKKDRVKIIRRCSGGGCVLQAKGVLNYALIEKCKDKYKTISSTNTQVMETFKKILNEIPELKNKISVKGVSDLTWDNKKISGNAQKRKKDTFLFHGTLLLNIKIDLVSKYLLSPEKMPNYRKEREHGDFIKNIEINERIIKNEIIKYFKATPFKKKLPLEETYKLIDSKYSKKTWNNKF